MIVTSARGMDYPSIVLPAELADHEIVASVSGGKDSTALMLALREAGIPFRAVFADTGWEHRSVYSHLDVLRERIGPIDVVRAEFNSDVLAELLLDLGVPPHLVPRLAASAMVARAITRAGFPAREQRWCTSELKIVPINDYLATVESETGRTTASAVGVRADESKKRQALLGNAWGGELEREADGPTGWGHWVWRPLLRWAVDDVLRIHLAHRVPVNPLYKLGVERVGCWPCIHAVKDEVRLIAETDELRIEEIAALEAAFTELRRRRNEETPGRYSHDRATFFLGDDRGPLGYAPGIERVAVWSRTSRGGRQLQLIDDGPRGGCMRWGLCDTGGE